MELSDESIERLGVAVAVGSEIGSEKGSAKAVDESNRIREREGSLEVRTNV